MKSNRAPVEVPFTLKERRPIFFVNCPACGANRNSKTHKLRCTRRSR